jgi:hypothetical protein
MGIINTALAALITFFAVLGFVVGAVKGYIKSKSWAVEVLLATLITVVVSVIVQNKLQLDTIVAGGITLAVGVVSIILMKLICASIRKGLTKAIAKRKQRSEYEQYDEVQEHTEEILQAIDENDKRSYSKLSKRKFRQSGGAWGALDRFLGAFTVAIKSVVIFGIIVCILLTAVDLTYLAAEGGILNGLFADVLSGSVWKFAKSYLFDFLTIALISLCISSGFKSGISNTIWSLFVLLMVVGIGWLSWYLSFNVAPFISFAELINTKVAALTESVAAILSNFGISTLTISQGLLTGMLFILMLVVVILIAAFVPKLIDRAREGVIFRTVDGVLGAIILTVFIFAILMVLGAVANSLSDYEFMNVFTSYFEKSKIATFVYNRNLLNELGLLVIPVAQLIG